MITQQGDVSLINTVDGGEIVVSGGLIEMTPGLETSTYLSLFGGNNDDDGSATTNLQWWGNLDETEPSRRLRSQTQYILKSLPITTGNMEVIRRAVIGDLASSKESGLYDSCDVLITIPKLNTVAIEINFVIGAESHSVYYSFYKNSLDSIIRKRISEEKYEYLRLTDIPNLAAIPNLDEYPR